MFYCKRLHHLFEPNYLCCFQMLPAKLLHCAYSSSTIIAAFRCCLPSYCVASAWSSSSCLRWPRSPPTAASRQTCVASVRTEYVRRTSTPCHLKYWSSARRAETTGAIYPASLTAVGVATRYSRSAWKPYSEARKTVRRMSTTATSINSVHRVRYRSPIPVHENVSRKVRVFTRR